MVGAQRLWIMFDYTLQIVVAGTVILGMVSGALGSFAVLRKQSLLGDAISHAALPGIAIAFLISMSKNPFYLLLGAIVAGVIGTVFMILVTRYTALKQDAVLGIILSVFFGFGLMLLTFIQRIPTARQSGLHTFLFGNASTLLIEDVIVMGILGLVCLLMVILLWKEFKLLSFDVDYARSQGIPTLGLDIFLTGLIVIAIVIGLQSVGVVLMSAMIIAPASAARQWTDKLGLMVVISAVFGATSGSLGAVISSHVSKLPTGPTIVLVVSGFVLVSLMFAPNRGLIPDWWRRRHVNLEASLDSSN